MGRVSAVRGECKGTQRWFVGGRKLRCALSPNTMQSGWSWGREEDKTQGMKQQGCVWFSHLQAAPQILTLSEASEGWSSSWAQLPSPGGRYIVFHPDMKSQGLQWVSSALERGRSRAIRALGVALTQLSYLASSCVTHWRHYRWLRMLHKAFQHGS